MQASTSLDLGILRLQWTKFVECSNFVFVAVGRFNHNNSDLSPTGSHSEVEPRLPEDGLPGPRQELLNRDGGTLQAFLSSPDRSFIIIRCKSHQYGSMMIFIGHPESDRFLKEDVVNDLASGCLLTTSRTSALLISPSTSGMPWQISAYHQYLVSIPSTCLAHSRLSMLKITSSATLATMSLVDPALRI